MTTMWFDRKPGEQVSIGKTETTVLVTTGIPDWVRLPSELGGDKARVLVSFEGTCPVCWDHQVRHLELAVDFAVAECGRKGFLWYRSEKAKEGASKCAP